MTEPASHEAGTELEASDLGASDLGASDLGASDLGASDLGASDLGRPDLDHPGLDHTVDTGPTPFDERVTYALRQGALMAVALLLASRVADQLQPVGETRGIVATPFLWAIVAWFVLLLFHALAFDRSQMRDLERVPLYVAAGIGALVFMVGLALYDAGSIGRRVAYLATNSLGALLFWWALIGIGFLITRRISTS